MITVRQLACVPVLSLVLAFPSMATGQVTADDFLPPVQGGPTDVKQPAKVKVKGDVVTAPTAQDAINTAVQVNTKELKGGDTDEVGAKMVRFPSGMGYVATGATTYRTMTNPVATRIAKRKAYVIAFVQAKKNLAEILGGLSNDGKEDIREALSNINLPDDEMTNIKTRSEESLTQAVQMMLRGFVVYQVKDDTDQNTVYVTIVTTPKTRGKCARPAPNAIEADSLRDGLNQIITEVRTSLVPPVGGRIITMRTTGETAFVGFGSTIVRSSENRAVQAKLNLSAQKIAAMRAKDALCGLIIGDRTSWKGSVVESLQDEVQEYEPLAKDDPLADNPAGAKKLEKARETFVAKIKATDTYQSARRGILPPGVSSKTWFDNDHAWAFGMSVYVPSLTNDAAAVGKAMADAEILQPIDDGGGKGGRKPDDEKKGGFTDKDDDKVKRPGKDVKEGPSGKVGDDEDL